MVDKEWVLDSSFGPFGSIAFSPVKLNYNTFLSNKDHLSVFASRPLHMLFPLPGTYFPAHSSFPKSLRGSSLPS